jgi:hypothetical protein
MELIIIGVYDDAAPAQAAKNELLASGFARRDVQLNPDHAQPATRGPAVQKEKHASVGGSIENFFQSLFSMGDKGTYSNVYAEAVRRGSHVLTVDVDSDERRLRAEDILRRHGAVDIDERSAQWVRQGWSGHDPQAGAQATGAGGAVRTVTRSSKKNNPPD